MQHPDSLQRHISRLEESHNKLEKELLLLEEFHQNDTPVALGIKKKKLYIKDELTRCRQTLVGML